MNRHPLPLDPEARQALAGEYVLGTLDARAAAAVREAAAADAALRAELEAWEDRLTPLASAIPQEAPPPDLWNRIEADLEAATTPAASAALHHAATLAHDAAAGLRRAIALWRAWAIGASAVAAALAGIALVQTDRTRQLEANLRAAPGIAAPGTPAPSMLAVQPASEPPVSQLAQPTPAAPAPGQPQVMQATSPDRGATLVRPAATDAAVAQPTLAPPHGAPIQVTPMQNAPGAVVNVPSPAGASGVRPASGSDDGAVIRR